MSDRRAASADKSSAQTTAQLRKHEKLPTANCQLKTENCQLKTENSFMLDEINHAVRQALLGLSSDAAWRTYTGVHQTELVECLCEVLGTQHVDLAASGSAALEMLLRACRLRPGEEVMLSAYDYPGNFSAVERVGARPALVDVAAGSWQLDWGSLNAAYTPECRVLIASHLHGQLQEIEQLHVWCRARGIWLIQDGCQALGARIGGKALGSYGDATIVSFGGSKVISAGRGGAWATNDDCLAQHARLAMGVGSGAFQMSELQAAVVNAQMPFLDRITQVTRAYFKQLAEKVSQHCPEAIAPWMDQIEQTAFYQAGWLGTSAGIDSTLKFRQGFDGFHRRSSRRCRISVPLINAAKVAEQTRTVHYSLAFQPTKIDGQVVIYNRASDQLRS